jgi:hypothetical protein
MSHGLRAGLASSGRGKRAPALRADRVKASETSESLDAGEHRVILACAGRASTKTGSRGLSVRLHNVSTNQGDSRGLPGTGEDENASAFRLVYLLEATVRSYPAR